MANPIEIITSQFVPGTSTPMFEATASTIVTAINVTNTSNATVTISANLVSSGGVVGASNRIVEQRNIGPGSSYQFPEIQGHVLSQGSALHFGANIDSAATIHASGVVIT